MKILYIASTTDMAGGSTKSLIAMLLQAKKLGVEIEAVCPNEKGLTVWLRERGIKTHVAHYCSSNLPTSHTLADKMKWLPRLMYYYWINYRGANEVKRIAKEAAPDIIHENSSVINVGFSAAKVIGVPNIIHIREYGDLDFNLKLPGRKRRLKDRNVYTIYITKDIGRHLDQHLNPKATQIYDGIVSEADFRLTEDKERWFLFAGRLESAKGIEDLLEAYAEYAVLIKDPMPLYVCGGGGVPDYMEGLKNYTYEKGLGHLVKWLGNRYDIAEFMVRAAATIIPSRNEGLGRVMPEAMANGSLCVARNTGGTKEQLENGRELTGAPIAIAYETKTELIDTLLKITEKVDGGGAFLPGTDFRAMIEHSQKAVKEFFSVESFGDKVFDFYKKILSVTK